jgi:undecaprenyl-phosphate 4-deoxy-4-formamido-L-arabinose transferase
MNLPVEATKLSIVIPVFDEEACLPELIRRCLEACGELKLKFEIILVDDGSSDRSAEFIEQASAANPERVVGVLLNRNYGQHAAVMAGFEYCRGEIVVTLDADLQNPPEEIPRLVAEIQKGFDVVGTGRDSSFRKMSSTIVNRVVQKSTGVLMHDYGCMLRAYRRHIVSAMLQCHERSTFIPILANSFARRTAEIEVRHAARSVGNSKYPFWKLVSLQFDLLTGITTFPLRLLSLLGTLISAAGVGFGVFLLVMRLIYGPEWAVQGVFTLFAILFIFIGAQFIALGLLGEYLGRVYHDVRARPRFFVGRVTGRSDLSMNES